MNTPKRILFTQEGYNKLLQEKEELTQSRKAAVEDLAKARAMGDLSENGYYKSARFKLSSVDRRLRELTYLIRYAEIKETTLSDTIDIGSTVIVQLDTIEKTYNIVGGYESNPSEGKISHISPLGKALLGKKKGETVHITTPSGTSVYTILSIS